MMPLTKVNELGKSHLKNRPDDDFAARRRGQRSVVPEEVGSILGQEVLQRKQGHIVDHFVLVFDVFQS